MNTVRVASVRAMPPATKANRFISVISDIDEVAA